ncbi:MAG: phosphotransferase enzyme family protein [Anaerotardibacter sp.]
MGTNFEDPALFQAIAEEAASLWPFETYEVTFLAFSENATYLVRNPETDEKLGVLRVGRPGYHTLEEYNSEIAWLRQINDYTPLVVANPIPGTDGSYVQMVDKDGITYYCMMAEYLTGITLENETDLSAAPAHFRMLGEITAYLHRQTEIWNGANKLVRNHWDYETMLGPDAIWGRWWEYPEMTPECQEVLERCCAIIKRRLERYGKTSKNYGIIHADLRDTNIIIDGDQVKVIDFDDFGYGWHVHDLASALTLIETREDVADLVNAWLEGYKKVMPFTDTDFMEIDTFILQRRLQMMAWMGTHQDSTPVQGYMVGYLEGTMELAHRYLRLFG